MALKERNFYNTPVPLYEPGLPAIAILRAPSPASRAPAVGSIRHRSGTCSYTVLLALFAQLATIPI